MDSIKPNFKFASFFNDPLSGKGSVLKLIVAILSSNMRLKIINTIDDLKDTRRFRNDTIPY
jgi:hypothetical protein